MNQYTSHVAVNLFLQLHIHFIIRLFLGRVMYDNEFRTKGEKNLTKDKN